MGLNDQSRSLSNHGARKYIFKDGINFSHMTGKDAKLFRLLPAFHPSSDDAAISWMPSIDQNGNLADFALLIKVVRFVGHGKAGGTRMDLLSLKTFGDEQFCPLTHLWEIINQDPATWGYLIKDIGKFGDKDQVRAAFSRTTSQLVANVLDINQTVKGVQLGVFTQSASAALIDRKDGLVFTPSAMATDEQIRSNYLMAYANGDVTHPTDGAVLKCEKEDGKGDFSGYRVVVALDSHNRCMKRPIDQSHMKGRINLNKYAEYMNIPSAQDLVNSLIQLLNGRSPMGYHEHALLKLAFPQFRIPEPPTAMAAMPTVGNMGFAPSAAAPAGMAGSPVPAFVPPTMPGNPAPAGMAPYPGNYAVPTVGPAAAPVPAFVPPAFPIANMAPPPPPPAPAAAPVPVFVPPTMTGTDQAPQQAPVPGPQPVVPGDPVAANFDQGNFMSRLKAATAPTG